MRAFAKEAGQAAALRALLRDVVAQNGDADSQIEAVRSLLRASAAPGESAALRALAERLADRLAAATRRKVRRSRRKPGLKVARAVDEVLTVPGFAKAPQANATLDEIMRRTGGTRAGARKAVQRRAARLSHNSGGQA
jgi:hypothetical protein